MNRTDVITLLGQVLAMQLRSFPQYLAHARPYVPPGREEVLAVFRDITMDQSLMAGRLLERIDALGGAPTSSEFPMAFTTAHDLSIDYLLDRAIEYQQQDIAHLRRLSQALELAATDRALVDETLGMAQGHLESLEECRNVSSQPRSS